MGYRSEQDKMRRIARATKQRDWETIDAVLEEQRLLGNSSVMAGFRDALGHSTRLPPLDAPDPVTIHDLPSLNGVEIVGRGEGETRRWRKRKAA